MPLQSARLIGLLIASAPLLIGQAAWADCTPASGNNVTAVCTGTTINQAGGAPGTSGGTNGYGTGAETGLTVTVASGASVTGTSSGVTYSTGTVTNSGAISSPTGEAVHGGSSTLINSGTISGFNGIFSGGVSSVTNSGTISGVNVGMTIIVFGRGLTTTVTNSGTISGGNFGIEVAFGGATVFNSGIITGAVAIELGGSNSTLTLGPGSVISGNVIETGTLQLGGVGTGSFDASAIGPAAQYQNVDTFNKVGSSIWTLTGTSSFTGPVNVSGGTLIVNGDISSSSGVTVSPGSTLAGTGIVSSTSINGGILAPGNPIGTLTVRGNLVFTTAASYLVEVSGITAGRTNVTGTAMLGGGAVNVLFGPTVAKQYTILNATGGVSGTFGSFAANLPTGFTASLSYDAADVFLNIAISPAPAGLNGNQQNVATALANAFNSGGTVPLVTGALTPAGFTQLSGETATGSQQTTFQAMTQFMGVMTDPFIDGRGGASPSIGATGFAEEGNQASSYAATRGADAYAMFTKAPLAKTWDPHWSVWAAGFGGSQTTDGNTAQGSNSTTSRIFGTAVGADYIFSPRTIAGFALAGGGTNFSVANGGGGHSDLFQAGAFVRHTVGQAYITGALAYGWQDITTDRIVTVAGFDHLRAEFNANAFSGRVEGGYRFVMPWVGGFGITPYAAAQFTTFDLPAYAESAVSGVNTFALAYNAKSVTDTRSELGLRTDKSFAMPDSVLTLRGRVAWAHDFDPDRSIAATFQALPGASFTVNGAAQASDSALTTASVERKWINGFSLAATFEGEFSNVTSSYAGKGVARYVW
jgi:autotransporter-associated beta strand protein